MSNSEYREAQQQAREHGLKARQETREERANEKLVQQAYDEKLAQILADLDYRIKEYEGWIQIANDETRQFWLTMRGRGVPDRPAERDAYRRLADDIRGISSREASA